MFEWVRKRICWNELDNIEYLEEEMKALHQHNLELKAQLEETTPRGTGEAYWNNKWPRRRVVYRIAPQVVVDVRTVFGVMPEEEHELREIATRWEVYKPDVIAMKALNYVIGRTLYRTDRQTNNTPEFWQNAYSTFRSEVGDCEDGAILILKLMELAGVPAWRRKLCAGWVRQSPVAPQGGHAYAIYLADDNKWYVLDWCYFPSISVNAFKKKPHKDLAYYKDIWWTTNSQHTWIQKSFIIKEELKP